MGVTMLLLSLRNLIAGRSDLELLLIFSEWIYELIISFVTPIRKKNPEFLNFSRIFLMNLSTRLVTFGAPEFAIHQVGRPRGIQNAGLAPFHRSVTRGRMPLLRNPLQQRSACFSDCPFRTTETLGSPDPHQGGGSPVP